LIRKKLLLLPPLLLQPEMMCWNYQVTEVLISLTWKKNLPLLPHYKLMLQRKLTHPSRVSHLQQRKKITPLHVSSYLIPAVVLL
jgi:hypothetical protein